MGLAVVFGGLASFFAPQATSAVLSWTLPTLLIPDMSFSLSAFIAVSLPLVVFAMGLGNVQGLGFLIAQGYRVPITPVSVVTGINSVLNSFLGGHPASVARTGVAILAGPDSGPLPSRYWATLIASTLTFILALGAGTVSSLIRILPAAYAVSLAGLAILSSFQDALVKALSGELRFGALAAFAVAATPFALAGITSAFWAVIAGLVVSLVVERPELFKYWRQKGATDV